jgi:hypothetical protein
VRKIPILALVAALVLAVLPFGPTAAAPRCYPNNRFVVTSGMVQDTLTQLVWQQDGSGTRAGCSGTDNLTCTWAEAKAYCEALSLGSLSGWRLPTYKELSSIVDFTVASPGPTINQTAFPNTPPEYFWTSSPYAGSSGFAWDVYFKFGFSSYYGVYSDLRVRCVR